MGFGSFVSELIPGELPLADEPALAPESELSHCPPLFLVWQPKGMGFIVKRVALISRWLRIFASENRTCKTEVRTVRFLRYTVDNFIFTTNCKIQFTTNKMINFGD